MAQLRPRILLKQLGMSPWPKGLELRLRFKHFDFATLKPIEITPDFAEA